MMTPFSSVQPSEARKADHSPPSLLLATR